MTEGIILLSGGLDSTTLAAWIVETQVVDHLVPISFIYGQKHTRELKAAEAVADYYQLPKPVVYDLTKVFQGSKSTLIDRTLQTPQMTYQELSEQSGVSPTYVPYRNGTFLSIAAVAAVILKSSLIFCGVHAEDARNWAYPDCTPEFIGGMMNAIYVGTYHQVRLEAPFQYLMKKDIVKLGLSINAPYHLSWSCYEGRAEACGLCPTCVERLEAFRVNEATDPIKYKTQLSFL